ncbi:GNAT family N-acetyltransferase [Microbacterium sp. NPDC076768]|uniref:GNAT family N-acetyltransferase n=1 Tax=Microbacterium sp. NPDC076768 TaxID=3154858 RepID=UPI003426BFA9
MSRIRPYRPADRAALYEVCAKTADAGKDATGILSNDALWGDLFAVPYAERHPDLSWVVEAEDGRVIGYIVATDDTDAFYGWFHDSWWPAVRKSFPRPVDVASREDRMVDYGYSRAPGVGQNATDYPAHLHINLMPETQGQGLGRALVDTLFSELKRRGSRGLHLGIDPSNAGAAAFYERLGMTRLPAEPGGQAYGIRLTD